MITDEVLKLRQQAIDFYRIGCKEEALELYESAAESGDYLSTVHLAQHYLSQRKYGEAEMYLYEVIDAYNDASQSVEDALLIEAAAEAYCLLGDMESDDFAAAMAEKYWKEAARLGCVKAYYRLGYLLYNVYDEGIDHLEQALDYWKMGADAGDDKCVEPYNEHLHEDTKEPIYDGETDENGQPHGQGVMYYPKEELKLWCGFKVAPKCYEGQWCHGVKSGKGRMLYYTEHKWDRISYTGNWKNDMPEGTGRGCKHFRSEIEREFVEKYSYEGDWVAGVREGFGIENLEDKSTIATYWKEDKKQGKGIICTPDGKSFQGVWEADELNMSSCTMEEGF